MAKNTSYVATSPILAKVLEENQRLVSPGKDEYGPQEEEKSKYHSLGMDDSPPRQSQGKTENVQSTESPGRNGPFDLKEFIAKLQTSPKKSGSPKKENSKSAGSALIQEKMDNDLENGGEPRETSTINQKEQWAITDGHHDADVQLNVLNPDKVVDSSNDDMAWKADPHGFYQSSKNSNFTTLRFSDIDVSDVSEGEEKSDDGRFSKGDSDEIADGDRLKYDESSNGRYKRNITEFDLLNLTDNANKTTGIPMVVIQAPTPSDMSRASSSVGSSRSETPETEAQKDVVSTTRRSSNIERSSSKDSVTEDDLSSCSEIEDDTIVTRPCPGNEVSSTDFTVGEHGLSSLSKDTVTKDGLTSQPEKTDLIDGIFGEENKYFRIGDAKLSNNNISESVLEVNETNLDDKRTQIIRSDFQETDRSLDPDLHDDVTALSDISADLDESFESADMANNSLMTSWSELEIVRAISQNEHSETVKFSKTVDSSPKITWGSTTTAHNDVSTKINDVETGNDMLRTSIGSATELRAILERSDPIGVDISSGSVVLGGHGSFDSDADFSLAEEDVIAAEPADEDTQGEYILQECTRDEPTEKEHTEAISNWATQSSPKTLERAEEGTGYKFKFRIAKEEEAAEKIINEFLSSFDEGDVLGEDGSDTNATPLMPVQTTEIQPTQKSMNVLFRKLQFDRIPETELGDINGDSGQDELLLTNATAAQKSVNNLYSRPQFGIIPDTGSDDLDRENSPDELAKSPSPTNEIATGRLIDDRHGRPHYNRVIDTGSDDLDQENSPDELAKSLLPTNEIATGRLIDDRHGRPHYNRVIDTGSGDLDRENSPDELAKSPLPINEIATGKLIDNQHGRTHYNRVIDTESGDLDRENSSDELAKSPLPTKEIATGRLIDNQHGRTHYNRVIDTESGDLDRENSSDELAKSPLPTNEIATGRLIDDQYERPHYNRVIDTGSDDLDRENSPDELAKSLLPTKEIATGRLIDNQHGRTHHDRVIDTEPDDLDRENSPGDLAKSGLLTDETGTERLMKNRHGRPHHDKLLDNESVGLNWENGQDESTNASLLRSETVAERSMNDRYTRSHYQRTPDNRSGNLDWENRPDYLSNVLEDLEAITLLKSVELERERLETVRGMRIKMEETFGGLPIEKIPACVYDKWQELIGDIIGEQDMHFQGLEEEQESLIKGMRLEIENLTKEMFGLRKIATDTESCKLENELLRKQLNGLEGYVSSLEGRIKCKTTENVSVMEELEDVRQEMTSKQREFKSYVNDSEQEITNLKSEIGCMKEERLKLLNEIKMKEIEYKKLVNEKEKVKDELQSDVGKINANSISLRNKIMELQQENETLKTANEADQTIIRHLEIKEGNLSDAMEELRKEKSKILKDLEESRIKEVDMRQEQEVINSEKNDFIKQNDVLKEKIRQIGVEKQSVTQELNSKMNTDLKNIEAMLQELKNLEASLNSVRKEKSLVEDKYNMLKYENERLHKMLHIKKRKHDVNKSDRNNHQRDTDLLIDLGPEINSRHGADTPQSMNSVGQSSMSDALDTFRSSNVSRSTEFIDAATLSTPRECKAPESSVSPLKATGSQNSFSGRKVAESLTPVTYREAQHLQASRETQPPGESIPSRDAISPSTNRRDVPRLYDSESESIDSYAPLPISSLGYSGPGYSGFSNGTPVPDVMVVRVESPTRKHANGTSQTQVKRSAAPDQRQNQHIVGNGKSNSYSAEDTRSWLRSMETKLEQTDQILKSMKKSNQVQV